MTEIKTLAQIALGISIGIALVLLVIRPMQTVLTYEYYGVDMLTPDGKKWNYSVVYAPNPIRAADYVKSQNPDYSTKNVTLITP